MASAAVVVCRPIGLVAGAGSGFRRNRVQQLGLDLQLAKITTLGERVEDTFLIDGPALQHNRGQLAFETELLDALA